MERAQEGSAADRMIREGLGEEVVARRSQSQKDLGKRIASTKALRWK